MSRRGSREMRSLTWGRRGVRVSRLESSESSAVVCGSRALATRTCAGRSVAPPVDCIRGTQACARTRFSSRPRPA